MTEITLFLARFGARSEPDWGDLQEVYRVLRAYGYSLVRSGGRIRLDGHVATPGTLRALAARLAQGRVHWQQTSGRAA